MEWDARIYIYTRCVKRWVFLTYWNNRLRYVLPLAWDLKIVLDATWVTSLQITVRAAKDRRRLRCMEKLVTDGRKSMTGSISFIQPPTIRIKYLKTFSWKIYRYICNLKINPPKRNLPSKWKNILFFFGSIKLTPRNKREDAFKERKKTFSNNNQVSTVGGLKNARKNVQRHHYK